ncbi:hypothetical protein BX070DRAFT_233045 [Coemansia spiralis]|nr:hypothetical protein BX070DRAFT_233045 [Coemansia spiralis]
MQEASVPPKNSNSISSVDLTKTLWTTDQSKLLLQLAKANREDNYSVAWKEVMAYVSGWTPAACATRYKTMMKQYRKYLSGANISDHYKDIVLEAEDLFQECQEFDDKFRNIRVEWTLEQDVEMLELFCQGKKSRQVAEALGLKSGKHCKGRIRQLVDRQDKFDRNQLILANPDQLIPTRQLPDGRTVMVGQIEFVDRRVKKQKTKPQPTRLWTQADDDRLHDLVMERGKFVFSELKQHFPGTRVHHFYRSLDRIPVSNRETPQMLWTEEEEEALMQLVEKHGLEWRKIAKEMPTNRNTAQCRAFYRLRTMGVPRKTTIWPEEENLRLEIVVELFKQNVLLPFSQQVNTPCRSRSLRSSSSLVPDKSATVDELKEKLDDLRRLGAYGELSEDPDDQGDKKIDWKVIAPYMTSKTPRQCYRRWFAIQRKRHGLRNSLYEGPWTREEDLELYKLYTQAPQRWKWISENLPRFRDVHKIQRRYFKHIKYYVDLLIKQRGSDWDPTGDQFEEIHRLCEIKAWRNRQFKGYRIRDGYEPPANLDLNGDSYCLENAEPQLILEGSEIGCYLGVDSNILTTFSQDPEGDS